MSREENNILLATFIQNRFYISDVILNVAHYVNEQQKIHLEKKPEEWARINLRIELDHYGGI